MNTERRVLLGAGAGLALPFWMAGPFLRAEQKDAAAGDATNLETAMEQARAVGKPLLVVLTDPEERVPGQVWGEFFAHATQEVWLDLALVEVVCLARAELGDLAIEKEGEPLWALVFETPKGAQAVQRVAGELPSVARLGRSEQHGYKETVTRRAQRLAELLRAAILPDENALSRRAAESKASLSQQRMGGDHGAFEAVTGREVTARFVDLDRFAAVVRFDADGLARHAHLALGARVRLFERDPRGARWITTSNYCPPCGMGFTPPASRYFLDFYTK